MLSDHKMDGGAAIWAQNAEALDHALSDGWSLPQAPLKSGYAKDLTLVLRIVSSGWVEGWKVWLRHNPEMSAHPTIIEAVLSQAQHQILSEIIKVNNGTIPWDRTEDELLPPHFIFQLIGSQMGRQVPSENIVQTAEVLRQAGIDPQSPYPGDFEQGAWSQPGHTLWSWALVWGYWDLAEGLMVGDEVFNMPQCTTGLDRWFEKAWVPDWVSAAGPALRMGAEFARETWLRWMTDTRFLQWSKRSEMPTSAEFHLALRTLPKQYQAILWPLWVSQNGRWSPLHDLVSADLPSDEVRATLDHIQKVLPNDLWVAGWEGQDDYGLSALSIWTEKHA